MMDFSEIERVLVVTAHPDDVDFGAAGTVANMTDAGIEVVYCLVTDGQAGGFDHSIPRTEMAAIRREEQTKAAAEVGVTRLIFLGHMDGEAVADMQLRHDISAAIREVRPQVVIT
jgi:LmbE family N-acetylglucosaminyl deacetylase